MAAVGWYPDPGGRPGQYRYWNGSSWSSHTTADPRRTPPPSEQDSAPTSARSTNRRQAIGWWIGIGIAVLVVAVIIWAVIRVLPTLNADGNPWTPGGNASANFCTAGVNTSTASPQPQAPGRVSAGHLSFPELGDPWQQPTPDNRVPFGTIAMMQTAPDQSDYDGKGNDWVSSILVSDLVSGDGFADARSASTVVLACVLGKYYADNVVHQQQISAGAHTVDGHAGWMIETQLSYDIPGLRAKGERVLLLVVQVKPDQYGLFYASVPDTSSDRLPDARKALSELKVSG